MFVFFSFQCQNPFVLASFVQKAILFHCCLSIFVKIIVYICVGLFLDSCSIDICSYKYHTALIL